MTPRRPSFLRSARMQASMRALAGLALLLMQLAPFVSRWQSVQHVPAWTAQADVCGSADARLEHLRGAARHHHAGHAGHEDGAACDYCVLAAQLLPFAAASWPPPGAAPAGPPGFVARAAPIRAWWPARHPRGPPPRA